MENNIFQGLSLDELKKILRDLELYKELRTKLWKRWVQKFHNLQTGKKHFTVEYFHAIDENLAYEEAKKVYKQIFSLDVEKQEITFKKVEDILWGIRVFVDDKIVDLSYLKVERELSK